MPAGQGKPAKTRVYATTDGRLVGEHDPRGAYLAYAVGDEVPAERVDEYDKVAAGPVPDWDALREQQVSGRPAGPDGETVFVHDDLATVLADEARVLANSPAHVRVAVAERAGGVVANRRLLRTEDGELVNDGDERGLTLAYIAGDAIKQADIDSYLALTPAADESAEVKMRTAVANKAQTTKPTK